MNNDIADRYYELKRTQTEAELPLPDEMTVKAKRLVEAFEEMDLTALEESRKKQWVEYYDSQIPDDAIFTGEEVFIGKERKRAQKDKAQKMRHSEALIDKVLLAFLEVDRQGGTSAEALKKAWASLSVEEHSSKITQKTLRDWLKVIQPYSNIKTSPRGRPKNK